ncbi:helix-turn-helix domain-containing protein [Luteimonas sp. TWI662]|uniref:helix-turn-helix domain-containing protein n=1 Tax=Luteimonas sp. TWI662 TaxID=3136789 RepID=UPI003208E409
MSIAATKWALQQQVGDPGTKLVLVAMAQLLNKENRCYPGAAYLAQVTEQSVGKVHNDLTALTELKLLGDTGLRAGPRRRGIVWQLAVAGPVTHYELRL